MQKRSSSFPTKRIQQVLESRFGLEELRGAQGQVIDAVLRHEDTLAILPTGAGKSLCFQLPALLIPGTTLVISPLIALMKDQQEKLEALEIESLQLNSSLSTREQKDATARLSKTDFIYTTPERLMDPEFIAELKKMQIDFVVIDEAHCITQWGHDFRPAYLNLREALKDLGQPPILALTATATEQVAEDIQRQLGLKKLNVIRAGVFRENLRYEAHVSDSEDEKDQVLAERLATFQGPGVIYASSIKAVEALYEKFQGREGGVVRYHGKLSSNDRREFQDTFMSGRAQLMIATNAFGMGIDKSDLRFVIHYNFPGSLEAYYQETGRAGRDGEEAHCSLLYLKKDQRTQNFFLAGKHPKPEHLIQVYRVLDTAKGRVTIASLQESCPAVPKSKVRVVLVTLRDAGIVSLTSKGPRLEKKGLSDARLTSISQIFEEKSNADREKLKSMIVYAQTALCRWNGILKYFGEEPLKDGCQVCDNCVRLKAHPLAEIQH